jgi:hypothetical protein
MRASSACKRKGIDKRQREFERFNEVTHYKAGQEAKTSREINFFVPSRSTRLIC